MFDTKAVFLQMTGFKLKSCYIPYNELLKKEAMSYNKSKLNISNDTQINAKKFQAVIDKITSLELGDNIMKIC